MRNVFDQYEQPENRLSHALATCLHEDPVFLAAFLRWTGCSRPGRSNIKVLEQSIPWRISERGEDPLGLPDVWVYDSEGWCLLIESKVAAALRDDQLRRHLRIAQRAGFRSVEALALTVGAANDGICDGWRTRQWSNVYSLALDLRPRSIWAGRLADYLEIAEAKLAREEYLKEGTLTVFEGLRFDEDHPFTYLQAKRLLKLLMQELRQQEDLLSIGVRQNKPGRPAITDTSGRVWDFLSLVDADGEGFTKHPHLTIGLEPVQMSVMVTLPHAARREYRRHLLDLDEDGFERLLGEVGARITESVSKVSGACPAMYALQRHFRSQSSPGIEDARLSFDLRTLFADKRSGVKPQPQWAQAVYRVLAEKRSNVQIGLGAYLPYSADAVRTRDVVQVISSVWLASTPWLRDGLGVLRA